MLKRTNPTISSFTAKNEVTKYDDLNLKNADLRFAFAVEGFIDKQLKDDPRFVKYMVRTVTRDNGKETEKILPHRKCSPSDLDALAPPAEDAIFQFKEYTEDPTRDLFCLDWDELKDDVNIFGSWNDASRY